jgi:integrase
MTRRALTAASVDRIKSPMSGQVEHFDKGYPGLALRVSYGGGKSWAFFYRIAGRLRRMTLGTYPAMSLAEAREAWRNARLEAAMGRDPSLSRRGKPASDFSSVAMEWLKRDQADNRSYREVERIVMRELIPVWGHRPVDDLGRRDVLDLIDGIVDRGAVTMARRVQAYVHRLFKWALGRGIVDTNPASSLPMPGSETRRDRVLTDQELAIAWRASQETEWPFGPIFRMLILTAARRAEIGDLRWSEIDETEIRLPGERTKNAEPHVIPLSVAAKATLVDLPHIAQSEFVFSQNGLTSGAWWRAKTRFDTKVAKLGEPLTPWRIHDLRRTVATGMQKLGVGLQAIEAVLGHVGGSRSGIVGVYQRHSFDAEKRAALEAWGAHVMALVEGRQPGKVVPFGSKR